MSQVLSFCIIGGWGWPSMFLSFLIMKAPQIHIILAILLQLSGGSISKTSKCHTSLRTNLSIELQDTLRSNPPENKEMKKASFVGISTTSLFYILCGCVGYAAFGNDAPGNFLTGFGFYEPFWLIDFANVCIAVHLIGAYQVKRLDRRTPTWIMSFMLGLILVPLSA